MSTPAKIVAILTARPGKDLELEALLRRLGASSRAEPGNLRWDIWREGDDARRFVLDELYRDQAAVAAHRASAHFQEYLGQVAGLAERLSVVGYPVDVA